MSAEIGKFKRDVYFDVVSGMAICVIKDIDEWQAVLRWKLNGGDIAFKYIEEKNNGSAE